MGISVKVHKKTDKRCTWAYHKVDGCKPEDYRTHRCHRKSTNNECLTDTIHFNHGNITGPTITNDDKVMAEISDCAKAINYSDNGNRADKMNQLIQITNRAIQHKTSIATTPTTKICKPASSRVPLYTNNNTALQKRSMTKPNSNYPHCPRHQLRGWNSQQNPNLSTKLRIIKLRFTHQHHCTTQHL